MSTSKNDDKPNAILADKIAQDGEEAILYPEIIPDRDITIGGVKYSFLPLPDDKLVSGMKNLSLLTRVIDEMVTEARYSGGTNQFDILMKLPEIISSLIPVATSLITLYTGAEEEWLKANCPLSKKIEALNLIFKVEDVPLIIKNVKGMMDLMKPTPVIPNTTPASS